MVQGVDKLRRALVDELPKQVRAQLEIAMTEGAALIAAGAKFRVPVDMGNLRDSIRVSNVYTGRRGALVIRISAGEPTPDGYNTARLVEFGTVDTPAQPFMLPSQRANRKRAERRMRKAMVDAIRKEGF
jgi:HK97 gp10 family phage protein